MTNRMAIGISQPAGRLQRFTSAPQSLVHCRYARTARSRRASEAHASKGGQHSAFGAPRPCSRKRTMPAKRGVMPRRSHGYGPRRNTGMVTLQACMAGATRCFDCSTEGCTGTCVLTRVPN